GGGANHRALQRELALRTGLPARSSAEHGLAPEAREATFFAHLAVRCVLARPSTEPLVTGAARGAVLGKLSLPRLQRSDADSSPVPVATPGNADRLFPRVP